MGKAPPRWTDILSSSFSQHRLAFARLTIALGKKALTAAVARPNGKETSSPSAVASAVSTPHHGEEDQKPIRVEGEARRGRHGRCVARLRYRPQYRCRAQSPAGCERCYGSEAVL